MFGRWFQWFQQSTVFSESELSVTEDWNQRLCAGGNGAGYADGQILQQHGVAHIERIEQCIILCGIEGVSGRRKFGAGHLQRRDFVLQRIFQQLRPRDQHYHDGDVHGCDGLVLQQWYMAAMRGVVLQWRNMDPVRSVLQQRRQLDQGII